MLASLAIAVQATAQPRLPLDSPDPSGLPLSEAVALVEAYGLNRYRAQEVMVRVADSGDAAYRPRLRAIAASYTAVDELVAFTALHALWELGEPEAYFAANIRAYAADPVLAEYSAWVAARAPTDETLRLIETVASASGDALRDAEAAGVYADMLEVERQYQAGESEGVAFTDAFLARVFVNLLSRAYRFEAWDTSFLRIDPVLRTDDRTYLHPESVWAREKLRALAVTDPQVVRDVINGITSDPLVVEEYESALSPGLWAQAGPAFAAFILAEAFPDGAP